MTTIRGRYPPLLHVMIIELPVQLSPRDKNGMEPMALT